MRKRNILLTQIIYCVLMDALPLPLHLQLTLLLLAIIIIKINQNHEKKKARKDGYIKVILLEILFARS